MNERLSSLVNLSILSHSPSTTHSSAQTCLPSPRTISHISATPSRTTSLLPAVITHSHRSTPNWGPHMKQGKDFYKSRLLDLVHSHCTLSPNQTKGNSAASSTQSIPPHSNTQTLSLPPVINPIPIQSLPLQHDRHIDRHEATSPTPLLLGIQTQTVQSDTHAIARNSTPFIAIIATLKYSRKISPPRFFPTPLTLNLLRKLAPLIHRLTT